VSNTTTTKTTTTIFAMIALFAVGMIFSSPMTASVVAQQQPPDYLDLEKTVVKIKQDPMTETNFITDILYKIGGFLPEEDNVEPFGYGVVTQVINETGEPELNVIATTSHAGLLDAEVQDSAEDPILHNHYGVLGNDSVCEGNPSIEALTEEEIGQVFLKGKTIIVKDLPPSSTDVEITPGTNIQFVASFVLDPVFDDDEQEELIAVCVNPVEIQNDRAVIFGEKDFKPDYPSPDYENHDDDDDERYGNEYEYSSEMSYDNNYDYNQRY
jgi:hypothetical protein